MKKLKDSWSILVPQFLQGMRQMCIVSLKTSSLTFYWNKLTQPGKESRYVRVGKAGLWYTHVTARFQKEWIYKICSKARIYSSILICLWVIIAWRPRNNSLQLWLDSVCLIFPHGVLLLWQTSQRIHDTQTSLATVLLRFVENWIRTQQKNNLNECYFSLHYVPRELRALRPCVLITTKDATFKSRDVWKKFPTKVLHFPRQGHVSSRLRHTMAAEKVTTKEVKNFPIWHPRKYDYLTFRHTRPLAGTMGVGKYWQGRLDSMCRIHFLLLLVNSLQFIVLLMFCSVHVTFRICCHCCRHCCCHWRSFVFVAISAVVASARVCSYYASQLDTACHVVRMRSEVMLPQWEPQGR